MALHGVFFIPRKLHLVSNNSAPNNIYCVNTVKWISVKFLLHDIDKFVMVLPMHLRDKGIKKKWHQTSLNEWEHLVRLQNVIERESRTSVDRNNPHAKVIKMAFITVNRHSLLQYIGRRLVSIRYICY